jgi:hypothetical protein
MATQDPTMEKRTEQRLAELEKKLGLNKKDADARRKSLDNPRLGANGLAAPKFLTIANRLSRPDELAVVALAETGKRYHDGRRLATELIQQNGLGTAMTRLTARLNVSALDETSRYLLSDPNIYGSLVRVLLEPKLGDKAKLEKFVTDPVGFMASLREKFEEDDGPLHRFVRTLAAGALELSGATLDEKTMTGSRLIAELRAHPAPLSTGRVEPAIAAIHEAMLKEGNFPALVEAYVATREVDEHRFTPEVKAAMVRHLIARGIAIDLTKADQELKFLDGGYDEYFAQAYEQAVTAVAGEDDPIDAAMTKGATVTPWDFTVDTFETIEEQGVVKDNILAAGALDYVFELGERMGIFRLVDALTLNWAAGAIDVVDGPCAAKLYRYWKLRDQRSDPAERGLVYRRVLDKGEADVLERMVVNEPYPTLWGLLMEKVAEYIHKVEDAKAETGDTLLVSRTPIYQAVRNLQYNLTEFCTGMAHMQIREMYSQLREALDILGDPEIIDHFAGGRRKSLWTAIERLSKSEFGEAPNISAIRTAAVEGNAVFRFIANFQQGAVAEDEFQRFIEASEAWIIAKGSDETELVPIGAGEEEDEDLQEFGDDDF